MAPSSTGRQRRRRSRALLRSAEHHDSRRGQSRHAPSLSSSLEHRIRKLSMTLLERFLSMVSQAPGAAPEDAKMQVMSQKDDESGRAELNRRLNEYVEFPFPPGYAILLDGPWGAGKTHFISEYLAGLK